MRVMLGCPCAMGTVWSTETATAILTKASLKHQVQLVFSKGSGDNFNNLWAIALNKSRKDEIDLYINIHADIEPADWFVDTLVDELLKFKADFVSTLCPQKQVSGITCSGIGQMEDLWHTARTFVVSEAIRQLPQTFNEETLQLPPNMYLLHTNSLFVADMSRPCWYEKVDGSNYLRCVFEFPKAIEDVNGEYVTRGCSEDWYFSRMMHLAGARGFITRAVRLDHLGPIRYPSDKGMALVEHETLESAQSRMTDQPSVISQQ